MGNELSSEAYEGPTEVLDARDIASIAKYMKTDTCRTVFVMNGAGVSTSAGIPDFRSPGTGLYHNLERLNLPYPEAVFEINFFRENPIPFYTLARELMPGKYRPTPTHSFVKLLHNRRMLRMCYTQNIDTLERLAGLPDEAIVEAHGSFANQHCIECGSWYDQDKLRDQILRGEVAYCDCGGLVKPDIVFFGESLPVRFHKTIGLLRSADLLIVMGTSLKVHPFATLTQLVPESCPRVLINLDPAGDIGTRPDDVVLLGKSDDIVRELCEELGEDWVDELEALWKETEKYAHVEGAETEVKQDTVVPAEDKATAVEEDTLKAEVDKITEEIEKALHIGAVPVREDAPKVVRAGHQAGPQAGPHAEGSAEVEKSAEGSEAKEDIAVEEQVRLEIAMAPVEEAAETREAVANVEEEEEEADTSKITAAEKPTEGKL